MSTKKIKDVASKQAIALSLRTKTKREQSTDRKKKEEKTTSKVRSQRKEDEDKVKKPPLKPQSAVRKVSRPLVASTPKVSSRRPVTPPSSRVTKTQYFPSKKLYHNALTGEDLEKIKALTTKKKPAVQEEANSERPRTATLRKDSVLNKNNIVGPGVPTKSKVLKTPAEVPKKPKPPEQDIVEEYEDDFESYESDFEEYNSSSSTTTTSNIASASEYSETDSTEQETPPKRVSSAGTDDEKKLDSGTYELPEFKHKQILDKIKESIEKENQEQRSNLASLSDEGFEDGKSMQFLNFLGAQRRCKHRKSMEIRRKRGAEILNMIRLDHYSFTLLEFPPVPYDVFIKTFGRSNSVQAAVQTGEDDLDEETQTEEIASRNKWTQFPPECAQTHQIENENFWKMYKCNYLGVGGDEIPDVKLEGNETGLERFLVAAGNLVLNIQAEENVHIEKESQTKSNIPFSKGYILYETQKIEVLRARPINDISFCSNNPNKILTAHGQSENFSQSVICLWNISNVKEPEMVLVSYGEVTCVAFGLGCNNLVFGGSKDGTVSVWDIQESLVHHKTVIESFPMRTPTYSMEINRGHTSRVVSILSLSTCPKEENFFAAPQNSELCSLDEDGDVIIWSVIFKEPSRGKILENQGLAHWGAVIITINTRISLQTLYPEVEDFKCTDLALDSSHLFISTSHGVILHCLSNGGRTSVRKFLPDTPSQTNCLEVCPFSPQHVIAGFDNGDISFYSRAIERPLMVLSNKESAEGGACRIQKIQWSYNRPLVFYACDVTSTIHVWNLKVSDMFPVYSVPFKDKIMSMKLSPVGNRSDVLENTYMAIATEKGAVYVHLLDDDHGQQSLQEFEDDKRKFLNYISRYV